MKTYLEHLTAPRARKQGWHCIKHGMYSRPEYKAWAAMKARCTKPNHPRYPLYGARGIKVCQRWLDSFQNFFDDVGPRPDGYELDRIDNNGNYEPSNVRWTTKLESRRNRRRTWVRRKETKPRARYQQPELKLAA